MDTMLAEFIVDPGSYNLGSRNPRLRKILHEEMTHTEELIGKGKKQDQAWRDVAIELPWRRMCWLQMPR